MRSTKQDRRVARYKVHSYWCAQLLGALHAGVRVRVSLPRGSGDQNPTDPSTRLKPPFRLAVVASPVPAPGPGPLY